MPETRLVVDTPIYKRSAFKTWVKNSLTTLAGIPIVGGAGFVSWKTSFILAGVLIGKDLVMSMYEIIYGEEESLRPAPPPPAEPTAPTL